MNLTYTISGNLKNYLDKIDKLRIQILTHPISPKNEIRLKWDTKLERIIWNLAMGESALSKNDVVKVLTFPPKKPAPEEKDVINLKRAFEYIKENWTANPNPVSMTIIKKLYDIACRQTLGKVTGLTEYSEKRMNFFLDYLQKAKSEHPVIQAAIAQEQTINITPFDNGNGRIGRLLSYLYLYKSGYNIREIFVLEEFYKRDIVTYKRMLELAKIQGNLTLWLEYFAFGMGASLEKALEAIKNLNFAETLPASFWKLNSRQKQILEALEIPGSRITNKEVVSMSGISQITASRDLARLASLGLLLTHGKGRSVSYTKV